MILIIYCRSNAQADLSHIYICEYGNVHFVWLLLLHNNFRKHFECYLKQGQLLEGVECHIYLYCFTFDDINLNRAFVIIVLFPKKYSNKKVCANDKGKLNALGFYWYIVFRFNVIITRPFSG